MASLSPPSRNHRALATNSSGLDAGLKWYAWRIGCERPDWAPISPEATGMARPNAPVIGLIGIEQAIVRYLPFGFALGGCFGDEFVKDWRECVFEVRTVA